MLLTYPVSVFEIHKREDSVCIAFQFWVLAISIVALLNESIPHVLASLLTHVMATAWGAFQITSTATFRANFKRVINTDGACGQTLLDPSYWQARSRLEISSLGFNGLALITSCALTWNLHGTSDHTSYFLPGITEDLWLANLQTRWTFAHN